jgi:N-hydroxyarylamine O-acetyltransferase
MDINTLFRKRIGLSQKEEITFEKLGYVLDRVSQAIPFDNLAVMESRKINITNEYLVQKILENNEGGLCYEVNPLFYLFLIKNGFNVKMLTGNVYDKENHQFQTIGKTHVTILLYHEGKPFLIDTGFGSNLPLKPVPLSGETVTSKNGEFRVKELEAKTGKYLLEIKLKDKHTEWKKGYAFLVDSPIKSMDELNEIKDIIFEHEKSPFNKHPLVSYFTEGGRTVLTDTYLRHWENGVMRKEDIDNEKFEEMVGSIFKKCH